MGQPRPLFRFIFGLFKQTLQIFTTNICEKCPSSIRCRHSNLRPSECESPPITTWPGLPPIMAKQVTVQLLRDGKPIYRIIGRRNSWFAVLRKKVARLQTFHILCNDIVSLSRIQCVLYSNFECFNTYMHTCIHA